MRTLVTQTASQVQTPRSPSVTQVMRSYQVVLKCGDQTQREEINRRIRTLEERQHNLLSSHVVKKAVDFYRINPKERFFAAKLCKGVGKHPNIADSAFHWLYIAVKGKIDKEQKVQGLLKFLLNNPQQLVEWMVFERSPYTEHNLGKYWRVQRRYIINLLTSTRLHLASYFRKKKRNFYFSNSLVFNGALPLCTQKNIIQGIDDTLVYQTNTFSQLSPLSRNQQAFLNKLQLLKQEQQVVAPFLTSWINSFQNSRWKSLRNLAQELAELLGKPSRKLFSAIRQIVVFTLFDQFMQSVPQLLQGLPVAQLVPLPFKRKNKGRLPIKLLMKKDYVITRQGNASDLTRQIKKQGWTEFGFPQQGKKLLKAWVLFPPKVVEYIRNGAHVKVFQVYSGPAPSFKPRVDVVLEGEHECFHSSKLLQYYLQHIPSKNTSTLGLDVNRLGQYMVVFNTPVPLPPDLLALATQHDHLSKKVISELNQGFLRKRKEHSVLGSCKLKGELRRVYTRQHRFSERSFVAFLIFLLQ